jgi:hypothetical protein
LAKTIQRFADAGLKCIITELDMGIPSTTAANLEEQARNYRVITDIVLKNENCPNLVIWGLKDNNSWREASNPLLYTAGLSKKPAYYAVRSALRHHVIEKETAIQSVTSSATAPSHTAFDLCGRRLDTKQLTSGFYIIDGKMVLIKN